MSTIKIKCSRCNKDLSPNNFKQRKNGEYYKQCLECNKKTSANKLKNTKTKKDIVDYNISTHNKCHSCFQVLENHKFNKAKNGITKSCSECLLKHKKNQENKIKSTETNEGEKVCVKCNVIKVISDFSKTKDVYNKKCIDCSNKYATLQKKNKETRKELLQVKLNSLTMICSKCLNIKDKTSFNFRKTGEYNKQCIDCNSKQIDYLKTNKCPHALNKSSCRKCNGSSYCIHNKVRTYCADCDGGSLCEHKKRKDTCKLCRNGNQFCEHNKLRTICLLCVGGSFCEHKTRRTRCVSCNFSGFLKDRLSSRVGKALKNDKKNHSIEYLGCDIDVFKKHLENKFVEGMNWENYGSIWHIDHIIPIAYNHPSIDEVIKRLHYLNTQPLWALENISKGNRYIG